MSTFTKADSPLTMVRGRAGSLPMTFQDPNGGAVNITGFTLSARLGWQNAQAAIPVTVTDAAAGKFLVRWTDQHTAQLPLSQDSTRLEISIVDTLGETHDFLFPVYGAQM